MGSELENKCLQGIGTINNWFLVSINFTRSLNKKSSFNLCQILHCLLQIFIFFRFFHSQHISFTIENIRNSIQLICYGI